MAESAMYDGEQQGLLGSEKPALAWDSLPDHVRERFLAQDGNTKDRWESLPPDTQEEYYKVFDNENQAANQSGGSGPSATTTAAPKSSPKKASIKELWPGLPKRLREIWIKVEGNTSEKWLALDADAQKRIKVELNKKLQELESVPIPWERFDFRDLWLVEYETNSEATWNAIPADMQRKIIKRLRKSVMGETGSRSTSTRRAPVTWDTLEPKLQELYLSQVEGRTAETWNEMLPKDQRKERERLRRAQNKLNKKQEQEMRKKARLTPDLLNAWLSEERTLIEWLNLPTETKLNEMTRLNQKLAKTSPSDTPDTKGSGVKRRRGRPFGATSSSKRAKAAAREALGERARGAFHTIAKFQEETRTAAVQKDNMMVLIQAYKGGQKKGRGRPRKDDLHNRLIFRVFGSTLQDMKTLLKQAYHQVKNELDILNNEAEINPQVKLAKHEILFTTADIDRSFTKPAPTAQGGASSATQNQQAQAAAEQPAQAGAQSGQEAAPEAAPEAQQEATQEPAQQQMLLPQAPPPAQAALPQQGFQYEAGQEGSQEA